MEEPRNLREVLRKQVVQSPHTPVSLKRSKKQLADTPFVEKEEAREAGLCRGVHLGLQMQFSNRESREAAILGF